MATATKREAGEVRRDRARDRRVVRTKRAIRDALLRLLHECDYDKVTVTAVAREADIDRKTFYLHYSSIDDVIREIMVEQAGRIGSLLRVEPLSHGKGMDVENLFLQLSTAFLQDMPLDDRIVDHVSPEVLLNKIEGPLVDALLENDALGLAAAAGPYLRYCVSFFCAGLMAMYRQWLLDGSELPLESLAAVARIAVFDGVDGIVESAFDQDSELATRPAPQLEA